MCKTIEESGKKGKEQTCINKHKHRIKIRYSIQLSKSNDFAMTLY